MAASDEFPRGYSLRNFQSNGTTVAGVTIPAYPNITHVLTKIVAQVLLVEGAPAQFLPNIVVVSSIAEVFGFIELSSPGPPPTGGNYTASGTFEWDGEFPVGPNQAVTVQFNATESGVFEWIEVQGYDV